MRAAVKVIAIIATLGSIVYFIIACKQLSYQDITWGTFITTICSMVLNLVLLWALHNALARIERLEKDVSKSNGSLRKSDIIKMIDTSDEPRNPVESHSSAEIKKTVNPGDKPYKQCQACGAIERTNEKCCPMCNTPYETNEKSKKK